MSFESLTLSSSTGEAYSVDPLAFVPHKKPLKPHVFPLHPLPVASIRFWKRDWKHEEEKREEKRGEMSSELSLPTSKALLMSLPIVSALSTPVFCNPHTREITENQGAFQTGQDSPPSPSEESKGQLSRADDSVIWHIATGTGSAKERNVHCWEEAGRRRVRGVACYKKLLRQLHTDDMAGNG